jgi:hypothetical protein
MIKDQRPDGDRFALRRDKEMTPGARLDWLAAAREFVLETANKEEKTRQKQ